MPLPLHMAIDARRRVRGRLA
eukprot:SAG25_NODE_5606_length_639_cov_1.133333_1_plen_20_part_10